MTEQSQKNHKAPNTGSRITAVRWIAVIVVIALASCCILWKFGSSIFESAAGKLAAMDDERAIPDEHNAAIIYEQLLQTYSTPSLSVSFLGTEADRLTRKEPWRSEDYPELAEWLKGHQNTLAGLLEASKRQKCWFPISSDLARFASRVDRLPVMREWTFLLVRAANNDLGEGRIDAALEKYRCLFQLANHLHQQPLMIDYLVGTAVEAVALDVTAVFVVEGSATQQRLDTIESALSPTTDNFSQDYATVTKVERLLQRKESSLLTRLKNWWPGADRTDPVDRLRQLYLRLLIGRRASRILIALRRHKNRTGDWPESLDEIRPLVPGEVLVDPTNNGSFVYKLTDDGFTLYSRGENNIDENGQYKGSDPGEADDWLIWPPRGRESKSKDTGADSTQGSMSESEKVLDSRLLFRVADLVALFWQCSLCDYA
jgi:hypothetical protein